MNKIDILSIQNDLEENNDLINNQNTDLNKKENNDFNHILDIANDVFINLGTGFIENIYHKAMLIDLNRLNQYKTIETKKIIPISYKNINIGYVESDIVLHTENEIFILELKAFDRTITRKEINKKKKYIKFIENNENKIIKGIVINFNQKTYKVEHLIVN